MCGGYRMIYLGIAYKKLGTNVVKSSNEANNKQSSDESNEELDGTKCFSFFCSSALLHSIQNIILKL